MKRGGGRWFSLPQSFSNNSKLCDDGNTEDRDFMKKNSVNETMTVGINSTSSIYGTVLVRQTYVML